MVACHNQAMYRKRKRVYGGYYCYLVMNPTLQALLARGQCKDFRNKTGAAVLGTATSIKDFHHV